MLIMDQPSPINATIARDAAGADGNENTASQITQAPEDQQNDRSEKVAPLTRGEGIDGMGNIGITENSFSEESSSTASFMKQVKAAMAARLSSRSRRVNTTSFLNEPP